MRHVAPEDSKCAARDTSPGSLRVRRVSRVPLHLGPSRKLPSAPRVQRVILPPEASECDTCPEYPSRESSSGCRPSRHVSRVPKPRDPSRVLSECAACPDSPHREITPGTRRARHVSPGVFPFPPNFRKYQKMSKTLQNHRNSSFSQKNPKPIFTVSF